ncbi:tetraacyldisaccharide 4'-kinase [uncultured Christiangramia sp.]|uniref:tetraacyldisaccharide 4'-kinase n=1 Tax=uncultured Christiangramia sp. TaxID=503836 RepID=UPI00261285D4|nr:tetraacyldisaccharide 4'-kinase [uncultured Christiangramia sp.]
MPNPRKLLLPFSVVYKTVTGVRNQLYDQGFFNSLKFDIPVIAVGNLNMGGTGKSPMIEYLIHLLSKDAKLATLSRGYKRESSGFQIVEINDTASKSGDEPLQFKNKFPEITVAVDANRVEGINRLKKSGSNLILLDDAFQHRKVEAGLYILLTSYTDLFTEDFVLPAGNLRESRKCASRANIVVVTKCPQNLDETKQEEIRSKIKVYFKGPVFFSSIIYSEMIFAEKERKLLKDIEQKDFVLVTGIANPDPMISYLAEMNIELKHFKFSDHHNFSTDEIENLDTFESILTTEKDYMRLKSTKLARKLYYLPIQTKIISDAEKFDELILSYAQKK